jgi:hypothetical protein
VAEEDGPQRMCREAVAVDSAGRPPPTEKLHGVAELENRALSGSLSLSALFFFLIGCDCRRVACGENLGDNCPSLVRKSDPNAHRGAWINATTSP